jgi:4-alpha-glucanotransferase
MKWPRASGILAHPTAFPGRFGVGDLGPGALTMLDFLHRARQTLWQVLPLGPTGYGNSPYALLSAFAGNPLLISPERLLEENLLTPADLERAPIGREDRVDFGAVGRWKAELLRVSYARFEQAASHTLREEFSSFRAEQADWLDEFALFMALKDKHDGVSWVDWAAPYASRDPDALAAARETLADEIATHRYAQFLFFRQWGAIREEARKRGISIIGDLAIFVAHDSADVWANQRLFKLDRHGAPLVVAGVPPDYFSPTGQRWGNPIYRWDLMAADGYAWWIARVRQALELADIIRLDHFRGFEAHWEIPGANPTAESGRWVEGPGAALFEAIQEALGEAPFIAEDLGVITPPVRELRRRFGFPGMRVMQFGFDDGAASHHLPHHASAASVLYTGTHDNDTSAGWFAKLKAPQRAYTLRYLDTDAAHVPLSMIRAAQASVAQLVIAPLQDALGLGSEARMNYPSRADGNWEWRCPERLLTAEITGRLARYVDLYDR